MTKTVRSFPKVIRKYILATLSLFLLVYTLLLHVYMENSLWLAASYGLEIHGRHYERALELDPNTPLPNFYNIRAYETYEDLPDDVRSVFSKQEMQPGELLEVDFDGNGIEGDIEDSSILVFPYKLKTGRVVFFVQKFDGSDNESRFIDEFTTMSTFAVSMALGFLVLFLGVLWLLGRRLTTPSRRLASWAQDLSTSGLGHPVPDFGFQELNNVADELHSALVRNDNLVAREREFLQQASHELRTPITVISGNIELLSKYDLTEKQRQVANRIRRAAKTMTQLTETLLWLRREIDPLKDEEQEVVNLVSLAERCLDELQHLSETDGVECSLQNDTSHPVVHAPATPLYIVVSNLLRNAYQHTPQGRAVVKISEHRITVENHIVVKANAAGEVLGAVTTTGYGIGLKLVEQICQRCGWSFSSVRLDNGGLQVAVDLSKPAATSKE